MSTRTVSFSARLRAFNWLDPYAEYAARYESTLLAGDLDTAGYVRFLAQHYFVYQSLEAAADLMRTDPIAGPFVDDALHRTSALAADLEYLLGPDWARQIEPSPATRDYQTRIDEVKHVPAWFIAHHYTRCLGDLSRGLLVSDAMTKAYGGPDGAGTAFFRYDAIRDPQAYEDAYRRQLDALPLDDTALAGLVGEVGVAHRHTYTLLAELGGHTRRGRFG
jgi:heme oxygenase